MALDNPQVLFERCIFLDTETVPTQRDDIRAMIAAEINAERDEKLAHLKPPGNIKKQETLDAWHAETLPLLIMSITEEYKEKVGEAIHKTGLDGAFGQVACASLALGDEAPIELFDVQWQESGYEQWLLIEINKALRTRTGVQRGFTLVGHRIDFDRRMCRQRGIIRGVPMHWLLSEQLKPWDKGVYDTAIAWTGDQRLYISQAKLCKALGIADKGAEIGEEIDGSKVWAYIQRGEIAKVSKYCAGDVGRARDIYKRIEFLADENNQTMPF
jgi:3'-5' exonuclease